VGREDAREDESGEEEWAEVRGGDLLLEAVGSEVEAADGRGGVVDEDLYNIFP
jgi:hypothetical protein